MSSGEMLLQLVESLQHEAPGIGSFKCASVHSPEAIPSAPGNQAINEMRQLPCLAATPKKPYRVFVFRCVEPFMRIAPRTKTRGMLNGPENLGNTKRGPRLRFYDVSAVRTPKQPHCFRC